MNFNYCFFNKPVYSCKDTTKTIGKNTLHCNCEDIWIQISDFNSTCNQIFYLGVICRHSNSNIINFISALNDKLIQLGKHKYYIVGDFNINIDDKNRSVLICI